MSEAVWITVIVCGSVTVVASILVVGLGIFSGTTSSFDRWLTQRAEVAKLKAQHERMCPRLTDAPRGGK